MHVACRFYEFHRSEAMWMYAIRTGCEMDLGKSFGGAIDLKRCHSNILVSVDEDREQSARLMQNGSGAVSFELRYT